MLKIRPFLGLLLICSTLFGGPAQASAQQYIMPDFYLGQIVRGILSVASTIGFEQYEVIKNSESELKAQKALQQIYQYPRIKYTYDDVTIEVIKGVTGEPNGFAFGTYIFITQSLIELLSPEQLTAVIAHELSHSESAHNLQKAPLPLEATFYQLANITKALNEGKWPRSKDLVKSIKDLVRIGGLAMELQADCMAAQQLEFMHDQGLPHRATDLIEATNKLLGYNVAMDHSDDPTALRVQALLAKTYLNNSCDIF